MKLKVPSETNYLYPDLFISNEERGSDIYIMRKAILVAKVLFPSTRSYDITDKFIQYRKIPELQYYLLIEPMKKIVTLFSKNEQGEWETDFFNGEEEQINLTKIKMSFLTAELYE